MIGFFFLLLAVAAYAVASDKVVTRQDGLVTNETYFYGMSPPVYPSRKP